MATIYEAFGQLLGTARRGAHLTQEKLGELVGLSRTSITNIECGRQAIQLHQLYRFAEVLNLPLGRLLPMQRSRVGLQVDSGATLEQVQKREYLDKLIAASPIETI